MPVDFAGFEMIHKSKQYLLSAKAVRRCLGLALLLGVSVGYAQNFVGPQSNEIQYTGRVVFADDNSVKYSLNGVSINVNFEGTAIRGQFSSSQKSYLYLIIDGQDSPLERTVLELTGSTSQWITLATDLPPGPHNLEIVKLDEGSMVTFSGLEIDGDVLAPERRPELQLEFIGDSNTAGWNAWNAYDTGGNEASGAYHTFPGMVSRMLNAEYSLIGASGSGITSKARWNCREVWDRIHPYQPASEENSWSFDAGYWDFEPDAVVINLGANDYYGNASKEEIMNGWKSFVRDQVRLYYPSAHIVLANSYGWAYGEPADYVVEAVEELKDQGDQEVSYVRFPWLWGQEHAVVNEHAGFANILADHLAEVLDLSSPESLDISSFAELGEVYNGGFERTILPGMADGWRPSGSIEVVQDAQEAKEGGKFMRTENEGSVRFATRVEAGSLLTLTGWAKSGADVETGFFKILFKDQGQQTISSQQIQPDFTPDWQSFSLEAQVPAGVWSAWIVLESGVGSRIDFDQIELSASEPLGLVNPRFDFQVYPNPFGDVVNVDTQKEVRVFDANGKFVTYLENGTHSVGSWRPGLYFLLNADYTVAKRILKR